MATPFPRGVFTLSLDFELVWGSRDLAPDIGTLTRAAILTRERVFGPLLTLLRERGVVATWATVGHLFLAEAHREGGILHPDLVPPTHTWRPHPWLDGVPEGTEREHPAFYGRSLVLQLRDAGQEVGSHSFTHPIFGDPGCSAATAESEIARCVREAEALGITLRSFVFPRNKSGHVDVLARHGFTVWRGAEPTWHGLHGAGARLAHLADVARAATPATVLPFRDEHGLVCYPASATFLPVDGVRRLIPIRQRVRRCVRGLEQAAAEHRAFHLYFHPINLAGAPSELLAGVEAVLDHACRLRDAGRIEILSMGEVALRTPAGAASSAPS